MDYKIIEEKMNKAIDYMEDEFAKIRVGRANPTILNGIKVEYYGMLTPLNQMGSIAVPEAKQIVITPWDKSSLGHIEKAIHKAELGINPTNDGNCIRLIFPDLTEQRRKELCKDVKKLAEESKVAIRNIRREGMDMGKTAQKASEITEDELKQVEEKVQKLTDTYIAKIDKLAADKEKDIMVI
ncbi:MAG: ribosome recycling factor [Clostridia bacterium]